MEGKTAFAWRPQPYFQLKVATSDGNFTVGGLSGAVLFVEEDNPFNSPVNGFFLLLPCSSTGLRSDDHLGADNQDRLLDAIRSI